MKLNFETEIPGLDGTSLKDERGTTFTLKMASVNSLMSNFKGEENLAGVEKLGRWELARKIYLSKEEIELSVEEISRLKELIAKTYGPAIVGPVWTILEGKQL